MIVLKFWQIILILCVANFFIWLGIVWFFLKERIKRVWYKVSAKDAYIRTFFFYPNSTVGEFNTKYDEDYSFKHGEGRYNIEKTKIRFTGKWGTIPTLYYLFGNPNPLDFKEVIKKNGNNGAAVELDSMSYAMALEQKFIRDLMSEKTQMIILYIICGVNVLLTAVIAAKQFGLLDKIQGN